MRLAMWLAMLGYGLTQSGNTVRTPLNPEFPPTFFMKTVSLEFMQRIVLPEFPSSIRIIFVHVCLEKSKTIQATFKMSRTTILLH